MIRQFLIDFEAFQGLGPSDPLFFLLFELIVVDG